MKNVTVIALHELESADTGTMRVALGGRDSGWEWYFAGPGHDKTVEMSNRAARELLRMDRERQQAQFNGRKYKVPEETPDEIRERNVASVVGRITGWSPVEIGGTQLEFSESAARELLLDPKKATLLTQCLEFLADEKSFSQRSV